MERRKAITAAAATALTLLAGAAGIALNSGIVGAAAQDKVGTLTPVGSTATTPVTLYVDGSVPTAGAAPAVQPANGTPVTSSSASGYRSDDDSHGERDDDRGGQYEGAEDDD